MTIANKNSKSRLTAILCGIFVLSACSISRASEIYWINPGGGDFNTASNWDPAQVPGFHDTACFNLDAAYTVTWSAPVTNHTFRAIRGDITWDLQGHTYTYSNHPACYFGMSTSVVNMVIKNGTFTNVPAPWGSYHIQIQGDGTTVRFTPDSLLRTPEFQIGANATMIVDGQGAVASGQCRSMSGTVIVTNGGYYDCTSQFHAQSGSTIRITGEDSMMRTGGSTSFRCGPDGGVFISDGGTLFFNLPSYLSVNNTNGTHIVLDNGVIRDGSGHGLSNSMHSVIEGQGWITGKVSNAGGYIRPGGSNSVGTLFLIGTFSNQYDLGTGGTIEIELAGSGGEENDQFVVDGAIHAGGTLDIKLINGFEPAHKDIFNILDFTSITGEFDDINLPHAPENWDLSDLYTNGEIRFIRPPGVIFSVR